MPRKPSKNRIFAEDILFGLYLLRDYELESIGLTRREIVVAQHMLNGESEQRIAKALYLSKPGVKYHIKNIYGKANVKSRESFHIAIRSGIEKSERNWANKEDLRMEAEKRILAPGRATYGLVAFANR